MSDSLRVIFAGTPEFAAAALAQILAAGHTVPLVLTQPDRPAGRGMKLQASAVKQLAVQHNIPVAQPLSLRLDGKYPEDAAAAFEEFAVPETGRLFYEAGFAHLIELYERGILRRSQNHVLNTVRRFASSAAGKQQGFTVRYKPPVERKLNRKTNTVEWDEESLATYKRRDDVLYGKLDDAGLVTSCKDANGKW